MVTDIVNDLDQQDDFPRPGSYYYGFNQNPDKALKKLRRFKYINKVVIPLYRIRLLPLLGMGRIMYVMTTKGRKTGKKRRTALEIIRINDELYGGVTMPEKSHWLKNVLANPDDVWVQIGFRSFHAKLEFLNEEENIDFLKWYCKNKPTPSKTAFGWDPERDDVETADFSTLLKLYRMFRIHRYDQGQKKAE
ncbi:MAG: nitroreductase/quinone reductase family protein [Candidatus Hodarchaeales archaeon]|jgi:deazaflavin-dependent oxidoreductase (nitroreductase family)